MGYRSDVKYVIVFPSIEKRDEFLVKQKMLGDEHTKKAVSELEVLEGKPVVRFGEDGTKWYDSYPDVKAHHELLEIAEADFNACYYFVRIGEDANDIDAYSGGTDSHYAWEYISLVREIHWT